MNRINGNKRKAKPIDTEMMIGREIRSSSDADRVMAEIRSWAAGLNPRDELMVSIAQKQENGKLRKETFQYHLLPTASIATVDADVHREVPDGEHVFVGFYVFDDAIQAAFESWGELIKAQEN